MTINVDFNQQTLMYAIAAFPIIFCSFFALKHSRCILRGIWQLKKGLCYTIGGLGAAVAGIYSSYMLIPFVHNNPWSILFVIGIEFVIMLIILYLEIPDEVLDKWMQEQKGFNERDDNTWNQQGKR